MGIEDLPLSTLTAPQKPHKLLRRKGTGETAVAHLPFTYRDDLMMMLD